MESLLLNSCRGTSCCVIFCSGIFFCGICVVDLPFYNGCSVSFVVKYFVVESFVVESFVVESFVVDSFVAESL